MQKEVFEIAQTLLPSVLMEFLFLQSGVYGQKLKTECGPALFSLLIYLFNGKQYSSILVVVSIHTRIISNFINKEYLRTQDSSSPCIYHCSVCEIRWDLSCFRRDLVSTVNTIYWCLFIRYKDKHQSLVHMHLKKFLSLLKIAWPYSSSLLGTVLVMY